jgi:hypothetical protein
VESHVVTENYETRKNINEAYDIEIQTFSGLVSVDNRYRGKIVNDLNNKNNYFHSRGCTKL